MKSQVDWLRPKGTVAVPCSGNGCAPKPNDAPGSRWLMFVDSLDPRLPEGPFVCESCAGGVEVTRRGESTPEQFAQEIAEVTFVQRNGRKPLESDREEFAEYLTIAADVVAKGGL